MAYHEVTMLEIKEVLRLWVQGRGKKPIARHLGLDPKTVRGYLRVGEAEGLRREAGLDALTDDLLARVALRVRGPTGRPYGGNWAICGEQREFIEGKLRSGVRLSKVQRLLSRDRGVALPYTTLHRFAVGELDFGLPAPTIPIADCKPGTELQLDTGWVLTLEPDEKGHRHRKKAWIFTPALSRHRFVFPVDHETTKSGIEACEAAWEFYGGVFHVLIVDNTKAIVTEADPLYPKIVTTFLEYSQKRGFVIDTARVRHPKDKARVEKTVQSVRDDCYGGERIFDIDHGRRRAITWSLCEYGMRRHTSTGRFPREHFEAEEKAALLPAPTEPYDVPIWCDPKVARDQYAQVAKALYSMPRQYLSKTLRARADSQLVNFYDNGIVVRTHPRKPPGGRSTIESDFPPEKSAVARRDVAFFVNQAKVYGTNIGLFAERLLEGPAPWTRMRQIYTLTGLVKRFGEKRVEPCCEQALKYQMHNVYRLERMVETDAKLSPLRERQQSLPAPKYLRSPLQYQLPFFNQPKVEEITLPGQTTGESQ